MTGRGRPRAPTVRPASLAVTWVVALCAGVFAFPGSSSADVTVVQGGAYGYFTRISLFGGPPSDRGPAPTVTLPPQGGNLTASEPEGATAQYGPALVFQSGPMDVSTQGATGPTGSVTSSARVAGYRDDTDGDGPGPFLYQDVRSSCTARATGATATTTIANGIVETKYDPDTQEPIESQEVPANPPPGYTVEGTLDHVGDSFRVVFNEQTPNADGSLTVNAAHMYLRGPIAIGDVIIGQSTCGVTAPATTTTVAGVTTTSLAGAGEAQTTTTALGTTPTTRPIGTETVANTRFPGGLAAGAALVVLASGALLALGLARRSRRQ